MSIFTLTPSMWQRLSGALQNQDLWIALDTALNRHNVTFNWIKGHAGHPENERCDELARTCAGSENLAEDSGLTEE